MTNIQTESTALEKGHQISAVPSLLRNLFGLNDSSDTDYYVQIHDSATTPSNGAVPKITLKAFAGANFYLQRDALPYSFKNGIYVCISTTSATKTLAASNHAWFNAQHEVLA